MSLFCTVQIHSQPKFTSNLFSKMITSPLFSNQKLAFPSCILKSYVFRRSSLSFSKFEKMQQFDSFNSFTFNSNSKKRLSVMNATGLNKPQGYFSFSETEKFPLNLLTEETPIENSQILIKVTVPKEACKSIWYASLNKINKEIKAGGKKASKLSEKTLLKVVGEKKVKQIVLDNLLTETLPEALSSFTNRAIADSEKILTKLDDLIDQISPDSDLIYDVSIELAPEIKWHDENIYKNMKVNVEYDDIDIQKEVEKEINEKIKTYGSLRIAQHDGIKVGDVAIIDLFASKLNPDGTVGEIIESIQQKGFQVDTDGNDGLLKGFVSSLIGLERSQTKVFDLTLPDTWHIQSLKGVTAQFTVTCQEHFVRELPALDDSLAHKIIPEAKTMEEVNKLLSQKYKNILEKRKQEAVDLAITDELCKHCDADIPQTLWEEQGRQMYAIKLIDMQVGGRLSKEEIEAFSSAEMVEKFLKLKEEELKNEVIKSLAVADVFVKERLTVTKEELETEIKSTMDEFERYNQEYQKDKIREQAMEFLEGAKVLQFLRSHAQVTYLPKLS